MVPLSPPPFLPWRGWAERKGHSINPGSSHHHTQPIASYTGGVWTQWIGFPHPPAILFTRYRDAPLYKTSGLNGPADLSTDGREQERPTPLLLIAVDGRWFVAGKHSLSAAVVRIRESRLRTRLRIGLMDQNPFSRLLITFSE